ncbi:MAG TPA: acyclic terpene utilization AtuA family protein [Terracidiphilus sp.]
MRIGAGAGYSGDRIDPAVELAERGKINYLVFECLAERTIALAQKAKLKNPESGFDPLLEERMEAVLPLCVHNQIRIITNMGAANPAAAVVRTRAIAARLGLHGLRIAAVTGDDVLAAVAVGGFRFIENGQPVESLADRLVSANAYLGAEPILAALRAGADVVLTGRVADPSLFLAPLMHEFGWDASEWNLLGRGTVVGHLLECAGQVTGGYFADPGVKDVTGIAHLGFPIAEVSADGCALVTKVEGSGGEVTEATCKEQLLYEIQDPCCYLTPDVTADFSGVTLHQQSRDRVRVRDGKGHPRPEQLKASIGYRDGYIGEGQISYAGPGALGRAQMAARILEERLSAARLSALRFDYIGVSSIHGDSLSPIAHEPWEVRLRVVARAETEQLASRIQREVEALYTNGPAGGGGATGSIRETIAILSTLIGRDRVHPSVQMEVS